MSTTIIRIASPNIPALIVTSHCCSYVRRDGNWIRIGFGQDPGQAGKSRALHLVRTALSGFTVSPALQSGDNLTQFGPLSSPCRAGNVKILRGAWNEELLRILEGFPDLAHDDEVNPAAEPWKCSLPRYFRRDQLTGGAKPMPHPYWLQNAIRRNPRSASPGEPIAAPPEFDEATDRDGVPVAPVQTKPQRKKRPIRREAPYWAIGRKPAIEWLEENGFPEPGDGGQAALERYVADVLAARGYHPAESTIRRYVRRWIDEYRGRVNKGSLRAEPHLTY